MGRTRTSKLLARKRPRLFPIRDGVSARVYRPSPRFWEPLRSTLSTDDQRAHRRLVALHHEAQLPTAVTPLRVLDVLAWMQGKGYETP